MNCWLSVPAAAVLGLKDAKINYHMESILRMLLLQQYVHLQFLLMHIRGMRISRKPRLPLLFYHGSLPNVQNLTITMFGLRTLYYMDYRNQS